MILNTRMDSSSVGKKVLPKTILSTGNNGKVALLFSNGTLITIKPGSRFYLRTYKQLEGIVAGDVEPGKLEEEPTQSELSGHLDYGDLIVKAPKLKKGSSMKLTSPLGVAGIRGTMFQLLAVRNSVTGDIMGGINLISGDIDFTDTGGNLVTLLSGQSIQLATSKLGEPVASQTGELIDLSSTYGPALTDGFTPPPPQSIFPNLSISGEPQESDSESTEDPLGQSGPGSTASSGANFEFIHRLATDLFFEIEESEKSSADFSFESLVLAPTVDVPNPELEAPSPPASVTGETLAGLGAVPFITPQPNIIFNQFENDALIQAMDSGDRLIIEMRSYDEEFNSWAKLDPGVVGMAFTKYKLNVTEVWEPTEPVVVLRDRENAEMDAPLENQSRIYSVVYSTIDKSNFRNNRKRIVEVRATRPSVDESALETLLPSSIEMDDWNRNFEKWLSKIEQDSLVTDVRGNSLPHAQSESERDPSNGYFYLDPYPDLTPDWTSSQSEQLNFKLVAVDWRGLVTRSADLNFELKATDSVLEGPNVPNVVPMNDPDGIFEVWLGSINISDVRGNSLPHAQTEPEGDPSNGYFYLDPYPDLTPDWTSSQSEQLKFELFAVDWRGVVTSYDRVFELKATAAKTFGEEKHIYEINSSKLTVFDPDISAEDEFGSKFGWRNEQGGSIELTNVSPGTFNKESRLDELEDKEYKFTYRVSDWRGVGVDLNRTINVKATGPTLSVVDFQSKASVDYAPNFLEYKDPLGEFPNWLSGASAQNIETDKNYTEYIKVNENSPPFNYAQFDLNKDNENEVKLSFSVSEERYEFSKPLNFKVVDERFKKDITNPDWEDDLTDEIEKMITFVITPPSIIDFNRTIPLIPMNDPNNMFGNQTDHNFSGGWVNSIKVEDVNGTELKFKQIPDDEENGIFYLDPMPDLFSQGVTYFKIVGRDWRGVERRSEQLAVEVRATPPTIDGVEDYVRLEEELSDQILKDIEPDILAEDEFGNPIAFGAENNESSITLVNVIGPNNETPSYQLDQLQEDFLYILDYKVTDTRGIVSDVKRYLQVIASSPTIHNTTFSTEYKYGEAQGTDHTIEYTDPKQEFQPWLDGVTAKVYDLNTSTLLDYSGDGFTKAITSSRDQAGNTIDVPNLDDLPQSPGIHDLNFTVVDPRFKEGTTHGDWKDNLTFSTSITFSVVATMPTITGINALPDVVPMEDPNETFSGWLNDLNVTDLEGTPILYDQGATSGSRFKLDPSPNLDPGFIEPNEQTTEFRIIAFDSRSVERKSDSLSVIVRAVAPASEGEESLNYQLSSDPIVSLDPDISVTDEFGTKFDWGQETTDLSEISLFRVFGEDDANISFDNNFQLRELPKQSYKFIYKVVDYRGVVSEVNRNISITATSPRLFVEDFQSVEKVYSSLTPSGSPHGTNQLEYTDPWDELSLWFSGSVSALDYADTNLTEKVTLKVNDVSVSEFFTNPPDLEVGDNELSFQVVDPRFDEALTHSSWSDDLTTQLSKTITILITRPRLTITDFQSVRTPYPSNSPHGTNKLEYTDPWNELSDWFSGSVSALDYADTNLTERVTLKVNDVSVSEFFTNPPDLEVGDNELSFQLVDERFITNPDLFDPLSEVVIKDLEVRVTPPTFLEINASISHTQEVDGRDWLELDPWYETIKAKDVRGKDLNNTSIILQSSPDITITGDYDLNYTISDWRGIESSVGRTVEVIKTPPTLELTNGGWRDGLAFEQNGTIEYLVKPTDDYLNYDATSDDGEFTILSLPAGELTERKVYVQAIAFDGTDISESVMVGDTLINSLSNAVLDYETKGSHNLVISIDDSSFRNFQVNGNGATAILSPTVKIVDKLGPYLKIPDGLNPFSIAGVSNQPFPIPQIEIIDNFDSQSEIETYMLQGNSFTYDSKVHTDYPEDNLWIGADVPGISQNEILMFSGNYPEYLTYHQFTDLEGNAMRNTNISLDVNITDSIAPVVTLRGGDPLYVDLNATLNGLEAFVDPGLQILENLYIHNFGESTKQLDDGTVIWDYSEYLMNQGLLVVDIQPYDENTQEYGAVDTNGKTIQDILTDYNASNGDASRYLLTYRFTDRAGNQGNAVTRVIEFRNDPNDPSQVSFESTVSIPYEVEVGSLSSSDRPLVNAFIQFANGPLNTPISQKDVVLVTAEGNSSGNEYWEPNLVNYYEDESGQEYFVEDNRPSGSLTFTPKDLNGLPKLVVRYSAYNEFEQLFHYPLEVRFKDTTSPNFAIVSSGIVGDLPVGTVYVDQNVSGFEDAYNDGKSNEAGTHESLYNRRLLKDGSEFLGPNSSDAFSHLEEEGFWTPGNYIVEYVVRDDFNNSRTLQRSLSVADSVAPNMAMISHTFLSSDSDLSTSLDEVSENPIFTRAYITSNKTNYDSVSTALTISPSGFSSGQDTSTPYVVASGDYEFILKLSEANQSIADLGLELNRSTSQTINSTSHDTDTYTELTDAYGRKYAWHSAFQLSLLEQEFQDPGVYVENLSDYAISVSSNIKADYAEGGQLVKLTITYFAEQDTDAQSNSIVRGDVAGSRVYTFVDEVLPIISLSPETSNPNNSPNGPFIILEAGQSYDDTDGQSYYIWENNTKSSDTMILNKSVFDAVDGLILDSEILETVTNLSDNLSNTAVSATDQSRLNDIYQIKYDVADSSGNDAESAYRYIIVKDTSIPIISDSDGITERVVNIDYTLAYTDKQIRHELLQRITAVDFDDDIFVGATPGEDPFLEDNLTKKWQVQWKKLDNDPWQDLAYNSISTSLGSETYPIRPDSEAGFSVRISLTDDSENVSDYLFRKLRIIDGLSPTITLLGESQIHDFLRFSANANVGDETDEISGEVYSGSGFANGMHRIVMDNYTFIDPGAYAEDANSYFRITDGYKDLNGNGVGETYAIRRVSDRDHMVNCDDKIANSPDPDNEDVGVIFAYSVMEKVADPTLHFQTLLANDEYGFNTTLLADINSSLSPGDNEVSLSLVKIPDVDGQGYDFNTTDKDQKTNLDVVRITIEYRVKDGWGNLSDIKERDVFIYESKQFPNFAFYATPITDGGGGEFAHYYDNGTGRAYLNDTRKDSDGDGVSDFWEKAFGSNPIDKNSIPTDEDSNPLDFSNPLKYNDIDFDTSNP